MVVWGSFPRPPHVTGQKGRVAELVDAELCDIPSKCDFDRKKPQNKMRELTGSNPVPATNTTET